MNTTYIMIFLILDLLVLRVIKSLKIMKSFNFFTNLSIIIGYLLILLPRSTTITHFYFISQIIYLYIYLFIHN